MEGKLRRIRRSQLNEQLVRQSGPTIPQGGWIRTIREALGMSLESLGRRLNMSRQAVSQLEHGEAAGKVTINTLRAAADALNCDLVVYLKPRMSLDEMIHLQARMKAEESVSNADHTMSLESQELDATQRERLVEMKVRELLEKYETKIW